MRSLALAALVAGPVGAEDLSDPVESFVAGAALSVFYHEMGHALIDIEGVPIFGQEEDAADVFSVVMTEAIFDPRTALELAYDYALLFDADASARAASGEPTAWWDVHGPDEQRFYNTVCLFYGADPRRRGDYAEDMGLPEDRAEYCEDEFDQAWDAWGAVLDAVTERGAGDSLQLVLPAPGIVGAVLIEEVAALNEELSLAQPLRIEVAPCGEANAFYDPPETLILFCTEYEAELIAVAEELIQ